MLAFWSSQVAQEITNFLGGPVQTVEGATLVGALWATYRKHKCGHCFRIGRHVVTVRQVRRVGVTETHPSCKEHLDHDHASKVRGRVVV